MLKDNQLAGSMFFDLHFSEDKVSWISLRGKNFLSKFGPTASQSLIYCRATEGGLGGWGLSVSFENDAVRDRLTK